MNLVITELFAFSTNRREGRGHGPRQEDNLEEFLRTGTKSMAVAMAVVRELDKTLIKFRSYSHIITHKFDESFNKRTVELASEMPPTLLWLHH